MQGVLLANLGTPASPEPADVAAYLREFLSDPRVVDLPRWLWLPLLNGVIVPLRKYRTSRAYRKIWLPGGSPLLVNSRRIRDGLAAMLGAGVEVRLAMRYGAPSVADGLRSLREAGVTELVVLPLYPQFSFTTTQTVLDAVEEGLAEMDWSPGVTLVRDYHADPAWVGAVAGSIRGFQERHGVPERLLFSLHGIPQRYVDAGDPYAEQCRNGVAAIAAELGLAEERYLLTFQSRVGREPWLQPYTDVTLEGLPARGVRHVQVVCPGFAADCLETLEEIAMENRDRFLEHGGERYDYIPALNDSAEHVRALAGLVRSANAAGATADQSPV